jgi:PAS domain S-box-containing protein
MSTLPAEPSSGTDVVAFSIGMIALMQAIVWLREREPGMQWFAFGSLLGALLVGLDLALGSSTPMAIVLPTIYAARACIAVGLVQYLDIEARRRHALVATLLLPATLAALAIMSGLLTAGPAAALPLLWIDFGCAALCVVAARREPGAGHGLLALGMLIGPGPHLRHDFPAATLGFGIVVLVFSLMRNSRHSRHAQANAQRMANFYAALSQTNQAILRTAEPDALFKEICRICVDAGHALIACVYVVDGAHARRVASAGPTESFLAGIPNPWDITTSQARSSYTVQALTDGRCIVCNDYQNDPRSAPWRDQAIAHGVHALAWLPLQRDGRVAGVLMLAAGETGFFDAALVKLLDEMTEDISFALDNIDREAEHAEATRQVAAGLDRFSRLFQIAPVSAAIISLPDRRIVDVNDTICKRYNVSRDELIGRTTVAIAYRAISDDREQFYEELEREGQVRNRIVRMIDAQGKVHLDLMNAEKIGYLGRPCFLLMSLDITDLRAAEEAKQALAQAQAASRAKTQFLSHMSHELRTPLNAVLGFSDLVRQSAGDRLSARELAQLDHVQSAGWHLLQLITDVLDLSRIEAGQFGVHASRQELALLLDDAVEMSQPLAAQRHVTLHAEYRHEAATWAHADPTRLRQVVLNVLSNAVKYNQRDGSVHVHVFRRDASTFIEVLDTGLGMDPQQLEHLFEPFNRLGREQQGIEGIGIGLALARQLMKLMHGDVEVTSEAGRGTRVLLSLPCADAPGAEPAMRVAGFADAAPTDAAAPSGTVLYIEDNAVNTLLVEHLLARWADVRFVGAHDGASGIEAAIARRPDLILLDLQLPDLDGMTVLARLRGTASLEHVPVIVLSASAMPEDIAQAHAQGAADYWTKPLDTQQFLASVRTLLQPGSPPATPGQ